MDDTDRDPAFSYVRFSDPKQRKGSSEGRQAGDFLAFCERHHLAPAPDGEHFIDRGLSGFSGSHRAKGAMHRVEALAKGGKFPPRSVLVIEAWDRLSRMRPDKTIELLSSLLRSGLRIGVCRLDDLFSEEDFGTHKFTTLSVFVQLAFQESKQKSERVGRAADARKAAARSGEPVLIASHLPAWLRQEGKRLVPIDSAVATILSIFRRSADGIGCALIARALNAELVPTLGKRPTWTGPMVGEFLADERLRGVFTPTKGRNSRLEGTPIQGYYPCIVPDDLWYAARGAAQARRRITGRPAKGECNLFAGLLRFGQHAQPMSISARAPDEEGGPRRYYLQPTGGPGGPTAGRAFPYDVFEREILREIREVDPAVLLGTWQEGGALDALLTERRALTDRVAEIDRDLDEAYSRSAAAAADRARERLAALEVEVEAERARQSSPLLLRWQDCQSMLDSLPSEVDRPAARLRLRGALQQILRHVRVVVVRRGIYRLAAVQVTYREDGKRWYLLVYRPRHNAFGASVPEASAGRASDLIPEADGLDFSVPDHVARLEAALLRVDLGAIKGRLPDPA